MECTKSESEVSMKDVDDEVDEYEEVKPSRSRRNNAIKHASFPRRRTMSQKLNTLRTRWKSTMVMSPKKRLVYTLSMPISFETNKHVQGDSLTQLLLAEPVSDSFLRHRVTKV